MRLREAPSSAARDRVLAGDIAEAAHPLTGGRADLDPLMDLIGDARFVLLGEGSHGTHEFYKERARITTRLIQEKGFRAIAVEGDWPDCLRVNRFVLGRSKDAEAVDALGDFQRFPSWMWRNADVLDFVGWLRDWNDGEFDDAKKPGFYGLDLYSLHASAAAVLGYLDRVDPDAAARARQRYSCFEAFGEDPQTYGRATALGLSPDCEAEVMREVLDLQRHRHDYLSRDGHVAEDDYFFAEENARIVGDAETYYRSMFEGRVNSWNVRDRHMAATLERLAAHLERRRPGAKVVVWAHNSHVGDARATWMDRAGELNIGQLARERWGRDAVLVGFTTHSGTVTAASDWDAPAERKRVRPALAGSYERLFHETGVPRFLLTLRGDSEATRGLREERIGRAIGVVYRPDTERQSHYFEARLPDQFDAVIHLDETRAVEPLERTARWHTGEAPETYPTGL